jgi:hypothetical protein
VARNFEIVSVASWGAFGLGEQAAAQLPLCPLVASATAAGYASGAVPVDPGSLGLSSEANVVLNDQFRTYANYFP